MIRIRKARILSACVAALLTIALNAGCSGRTDKASDSATAPENASDSATAPENASGGAWAYGDEILYERGFSASK